MHMNAAADDSRISKIIVDDPLNHQKNTNIQRLPRLVGKRGGQYNYRSYRNRAEKWYKLENTRKYPEQQRVF